MHIRAACQTDIEPWLALRVVFWPHISPDEHRAEMTGILARPESCEVFLAFEPAAPADLPDATAASDRLIGFVEVELRTWAEGCKSSPVGYLEGWYVAEHGRIQGVGRLLVQAAEAWARAKGCTEMASDTEIHNQISQLAHSRLGYTEVERLVCFRKSLFEEEPAYDTPPRT
jgi:aminoglycoside 6'-N-acetyltransferase I